MKCPSAVRAVKGKPWRRLESEYEEADVHRVLDAFPECVLLVDSAHRILYANRAVQSKLAVGGGVIVGGFCQKVIHGRDEYCPGCPLEESIRGGYGAYQVELHAKETGQWLQAAVYPTGAVTPSGRPIFVHVTQDITGRKLAEHEVRENREVRMVRERILQHSLAERSLGAQLTAVLDEILSLPWLEVQKRGAIFLTDDETGNLVMVAQRGLGAALIEKCRSVPQGYCMCGRAALSGEVQFADRVDERHDVRYEGIKPHGHYCIPIVVSDNVRGVLNVYLDAGHCRAHMDERFLLEAADVIARIIERDRARATTELYVAKLQSALTATVTAMAQTHEMKDPYTAGHQARVAKLSMAIAYEMGLDTAGIEGIRIAGLLHDLGKVSVPAEILVKPGPLTALELSLVQRHPQTAYDILKNIEFPWPVAKMVLQHHERMDGSGYPQGLKGDDILLGARILGVADTVEAMASHRPYRPALGTAAGIEQITQHRGTLYDADVVDACIRLFTEKGFQF